jgi:UDP-glucuronate 4-epimerase
MAKSVLITGAAGFIGSSLADFLLRRGDSVIGVDNFDDHYDPRIKWRNVAQALGQPGYELHGADICDGAQLNEIVANSRPEVIVHLAAKVGIRPSFQRPGPTYRVNVNGFQNVLDACRRSEPSHLVVASSSTVYRDSPTPLVEDESPLQPISPYAASKRMNELMAHIHHRTYGLNVAVLRIFTTYGPRQRPDMAIHSFARRIQERQELRLFGDGREARGYIYVGDCVDGLVRAIDTPLPFEIINIGREETTQLEELVQMLSDLLGKTGRVERLPLGHGQVRVASASTEKASRLLGFKAEVAVAEGLRRFIDWLQAQPPMRSS